MQETTAQLAQQNYFRDTLPPATYADLARGDGPQAILVGLVQPDSQQPGTAFYLKIPGASVALGGLACFMQGENLETGAIILFRFQFEYGESIDMMFDMSLDINTLLLRAVVGHASTIVFLCDENMNFVGSIPLPLAQNFRKELNYAINQSRRYLANVPNDLRDFEKAIASFRQRMQNTQAGQDVEFIP